MKTKFLVGIAAVAVATAVGLFGGLLNGSKAGGGGVATAPEAAAGQLVAGFSPGDTAAFAAQLEDRVAANPADVQSLVLLGLAYQQRARETGDASFYPRSGAALSRAARLDPTNPLGATGLAALAASRHRFEEARALAERARRLAPDSAGPLGVLGDALVELGRYREAFVVFDRMVALKPNVASYSRVSYARELLGDSHGAIAAMRLAVEAAASTPDPAAWALVHLGNLFAERGRLDVAQRHYRHALAYVPGYAPALGALARIELWRGSHLKSVRLSRAALAVQEVPEHAVSLGDALVRLGRHQEAERAYARAEALEAAFAANGGQNQLETALFALDHHGNVVDALARAREGWRLRPSVEGEHVLAWALYQNGLCRQARVHSIRALRLGTKDWGAMLHRSLIESCLGHPAAARAFRERALAVNRHALAAFGSLAAEPEVRPVAL